MHWLANFSPALSSHMMEYHVLVSGAPLFSAIGHGLWNVAPAASTTEYVASTTNVRNAARPRTTTSVHVATAAWLHAQHIAGT